MSKTLYISNIEKNTGLVVLGYRFSSFHVFALSWLLVNYCNTQDAYETPTVSIIYISFIYVGKDSYQAGRLKDKNSIR